MSCAEQVPGVGGMRWSQVRDVSGVSGQEAGSAGPPPASPHEKDAAERERDARPLLLWVQDWLLIRWVRIPSPGRRLPVPATPAAGSPTRSARQVRGQGSLTCTRCALWEGGTVPRRAGLGMRGEGWARRDAQGGSPRPHSPVPRLSCGLNLPAPEDPRRSAPLRVSCSPRPRGCTGRAPPPASVPESTQLRRLSGTPGSGGGSEKRPSSAAPQEESLITTGCRSGLFPPLLSVLLPPRNADIFEGYPPPTKVCVRRGQFQPRKLVYRTPGSTMHPASLCILKITEPNKAYFLFVLKR